MDPLTISLAIAGVLKLIDVVAAAVEWRAEDKERFNRYRSKVEDMVREGRAPTEDEWAGLLGDLDAMTQELLAIRAAKAAGQPTT